MISSFAFTTALRLLSGFLMSAAQAGNRFWWNNLQRRTSADMKSRHFSRIT